MKRISLIGKVLVLRCTRLSRLPPAYYGTQALQAAGVSLVVFEFGNSTPAPTSEFPHLDFVTHWVRRLPAKLQSLAGFVAAVCYLAVMFIRDGRPKLIIAHGLAEYSATLILATVFRVPFVLQVHEIYHPQDVRGLNRYFLWGERLALKRAELLVYPDDPCATLYRRWLGITTPHLVVPNCPPLHRRGPITDIRARLKIPRQSVLLTYVGGIGSTTAIANAVEALVGFGDLHFLLIGWCEPGFAEQVKAQAKRLGVDDRVHFLGAMGQEKWQWLENSDLSFSVYLPTVLRVKYSAKGSNKLMESMAAGVPVIVGGNRYLHRFVATYGVGYAVDGTSAKSLAECFRAALAEKHLWPAMALRAVSLHEQRFNHQQQCRMMVRRVQIILQLTGHREGALASPVRDYHYLE